MTTIFGFVAEPFSSGTWFISPATKEGDVVKCHDLAGWLGSWSMKDGGAFFENISEHVLCEETMKIAQNYADEKNKG